MKQLLNKFKRFVGISLSLIFMITSFSSFCVSAKSTSEMKSEISDLEEKSKELETEISKLKKDKENQQQLKATLQNQINITQEKINACTDLIAKYNSEIAEHEKQIKQKNEEINETKFLFKKRMRSIYMTGSTNNELLILLDADNFADYLALSEVSKNISAHDKKLVNQMTEAITAINNAKAEINQKLSAQKTAKETLANEQAKLRSQQNEINGVIASLSEDQSALEAENKKYEAAINNLEKEIQAALAAAAAGSKNNITDKNPVFTSGQFTWPVPGYYNITSQFGQRWGRLHGGIDIASAGIRGKPIVAAADGVVLAAGYNNGGYGYWVMINHGVYNGKQYATVYGHMIANPSVSAGQSVKAGQHIGNVGTTGDSYGNHLHFEVRVNGSRTNPMNYFSRVR